jgi:hypothetical protein
MSDFGVFAFRSGLADVTIRFERRAHHEAEHAVVALQQGLAIRHARLVEPREVADRLAAQSRTVALRLRTCALFPCGLRRRTALCAE